jgi:hypothetical protein
MATQIMSTNEDRKFLEFLADTFNQNLLEDVAQWLGGNLTPEQVFDKERLEQWALDNGFVREPE